MYYIIQHDHKLNLESLEIWHCVTILNNMIIKIQLRKLRNMALCLNITIATESIQVSNISHATFRSDSVNSYFLAHPRGVYLILSCTMA